MSFKTRPGLMSFEWYIIDTRFSVVGLLPKRKMQAVQKSVTETVCRMPICVTVCPNVRVHGHRRNMREFIAWFTSEKHRIAGNLAGKLRVPNCGAYKASCFVGYQDCERKYQNENRMLMISQ